MLYPQTMRVFNNGAVTLTEQEALDLYGPGEVHAAVLGQSAVLRVREVDEDALLELLGLDEEPLDT